MNIVRKEYKNTYFAELTLISTYFLFNLIFHEIYL